MGTSSGVGGMLDAGEGIARSSRHRIDPPLHILKRGGGSWYMWCSGGPALTENTPGRRKCRACLALLREYKRDAVEAGDMAADDTLDPSWGV